MAIYTIQLAITNLSKRKVLSLPFSFLSANMNHPFGRIAVRGQEATSYQCKRKFKYLPCTTESSASKEEARTIREEYNFTFNLTVLTFAFKLTWINGVKHSN